MTTQLESALERTFRRLVRVVLRGRVEKLAPTTKGMPDRLVLLPGGRIFLVELKTDTGDTSPAQRVWHSRAADLGTQVYVLRGLADVQAWVNAQQVAQGV